MDLSQKKKDFQISKRLNKVFSLSVNTGRKVEEIIENDYPHFIPLLDKILQIQKIFTEYKRRNNLLDYDDLLVYLREFLNKGGTCSKSASFRN